jgi:hypothetical protein
MIPFRYQIFGNLIVALAISFLLRYAFQSGEGEIERKAEPFTTQPGMLMVRLRLHKSAPPEILELQILEQGRVSVVFPGEYTITLKNRANQTIHSISFQAIFVIPGDPPVPTDEIERIFVLPLSEQVEWVEVSGPAGIAEAQITR